MCQTRQRAQGILCVFPSPITKSGAILAGKIVLFLWNSSIIQESQRALWRYENERFSCSSSMILAQHIGKPSAVLLFRDKRSSRTALLYHSWSSSGGIPLVFESSFILFFVKATPHNSARADPEKIWVLIKALFRRCTLCTSRKSDEIRAQIF